MPAEMTAHSIHIAQTIIFSRKSKPRSNDSNASALGFGPAHDFHAPANCIVPATFNPDQRVEWRRAEVSVGREGQSQSRALV
jgi:hypothetical protein